MTENYTTYAAFVLICLLLLTLPFVPSFREWLRPTDVAALPISANYTSDIDHFAKRLHADASARLGLGEPTGFEEFEFVEAPVADTPGGVDWRQANKRLIARGNLRSAEPIRSSQPLYVQGNLQAGAESAFPSVYATGDVDLGAHSTVDDWAHADGVLSFGQGCVALRRVSAGKAIHLGAEARFERLHAPVLRFGSRVSSVLPPAGAEQTPGSYADLPGAVQQTPFLFLIRGDCALPAAHIYHGSLVVTGFLTIGAATTVVGDIKAREGLSIGHRAAVRGAVTCEKRVYAYKDSRAWGPVVSESDILVGACAVIGLADAPTTVSARNVIVEDGVVMHGTIWAREIGMVKPA